MAQDTQKVVKKTLTACLITKDEARQLPLCLASLEKQVDEIVVVDTGSTDDTVGIATRSGAVVSTISWKHDFADARNHSLSLASGDFVLVIDADETAPDDLRPRFDALTQSHSTFMGQVQIRSPYTDDQGQRRMAVSHVTRLFSREPMIQFAGAIHEQLIDRSGRCPRLATDIALHHTGYDLSAQAMMQKSKRNLDTLQAALQMTTLTTEHRSYLQYQLGKTLWAQTDLQGARTAFLCSLSDTPAGASYRPELVMSYLHTLKRLNLAAEIWDTLTVALRDYPDLPDLHFFMAGALLHFGIPDLPLVERCYRTCLAIGEKTAKYPSVEGVGSYLALHNLGLLYKATGRLDEARSCFCEATRLGYPRSE